MGQVAMDRRIRLLIVGALGCAISAPAHPPLVNSNDAVSAATQLDGGGCYPASISPSLLDMLVLLNPEWAALDVGTHTPPFSDPVTIHGTIDFAKINESGDFPADHVTDDQNTYLFTDPADMGLVATGNVGPEGPEGGNMELEWELGSYPLFAWAGRGDRFTGVGRWIWDCGHPLPNPTGTCSKTASQACVIDSDCGPPVCPGCLGGETCTGVNFNYHSEVHPLQAVAVSRIHGYDDSKESRSGGPATRTDVWISPNGGGAGDKCIVTHQASPFSLFAVDCYPLSQPLANVSSSNFEFDIPLLPRPPGHKNKKPPSVTVFDQTPPGLPRPGVTTTFVDGPNPFVHAAVHMTTPIQGQLPSQVGKTIISRWRDDETPVTRLKVNVTALEIVNPLKAVTPVIPARQLCSVTTTQDCSASACPAGETCLTLGGPTPGWQIFLEANGDWKEITGLEKVDTLTNLPQDLTFDVGLLPGDGLHLHATGKSLGCLEAQLYGQSLGRDLRLYGLTDGATCLADSSPDIGTFDIVYSGPEFGSNGGSMSYVTQSTGGDGGHCSVTTAQLCINNEDCPGESCVVTGGAFKLHYTITKVHARNGERDECSDDGDRDCRNGMHRCPERSSADDRRARCEP
ncbi:MAG TPA: hypothetical protein VK714_11260 [Myxococcota bacterium]|nr:hypothetical protein [Myxococcota bacterium]